jgi:hypothetical protein
VTEGSTVPHEYVQLAGRFLRGDLSAVEFSLAVVRRYKQETLVFDSETADAVNQLFYAAEGYCGDESIRDERDFDDRQLADAAATFISFVDSAS